MKKRSIKNLTLNKTSITSLNSNIGGALIKDPSFHGCNTGCDGDIKHSCGINPSHCAACEQQQVGGQVVFGNL